MSQTLAPVREAAPSPVSLRRVFVANARSEWTKLRTVRSTIWALVLSVIFTVGLGTLFTGIEVSRWDHRTLTEVKGFDPLLCSFAGLNLAQLSIGVLGVLVMTSEYSTRTIKLTFAAAEAGHESCSPGHHSCGGWQCRRGLHRRGKVPAAAVGRNRHRTPNRTELAGDDLITAPDLTAPRAITIHAPADLIWPWIAQLGQGRGGFYSYDWLENLLGLDIHSAERVVRSGSTFRPGTRSGWPQTSG